MTPLPPWLLQTLEPSPTPLAPREAAIAADEPTPVWMAAEQRPTPWNPPTQSDQMPGLEQGAPSPQAPASQVPAQPMPGLGGAGFFPSQGQSVPDVPTETFGDKLRRFFIGAGMGMAQGGAQRAFEMRRAELGQKQTILNAAAQQGLDIPASVLKDAGYDPKWAPVFNAYAAEQRRMREQQMGLLGQVFGGGQGAAPASTQPALPPGIPPPPPGAPPEAPPGVIPPAPTPTTRRATPGASTSLDIGGMKFNLSRPPVSEMEALKLGEHLTGNDFLAWAGTGRIAYPDMLKKATQLGVYNNPATQAALKDIGTAQYEAARAGIAGPNPPTNAEGIRNMNIAAFAATGFPHPDYQKALAENEGLVQSRIATLVRDWSASPLGRSLPFSQVVEAVAKQEGAYPSPQVLAQLVDLRRGQTTMLLRQPDSPLANASESAIEKAVQQDLGGIGLSEADRKRAEREAPVDKKVQAYLASQGRRPAMESDLTGAPGGQTVGQAVTAAEKQELEKKAHETEVMAAVKDAPQLAEKKIALSDKLHQVDLLRPAVELLAKEKILQSGPGWLDKAAVAYRTQTKTGRKDINDAINTVNRWGTALIVGREIASGQTASALRLKAIAEAEAKNVLGAPKSFWDTFLKDADKSLREQQAEVQRRLDLVPKAGTTTGTTPKPDSQKTAAELLGSGYQVLAPSFVNAAKQLYPNEDIRSVLTDPAKVSRVREAEAVTLRGGGAATGGETISRTSPAYQNARSKGLTDQQIQQKYPGLRIVD